MVPRKEDILSFLVSLIFWNFSPLAGVPAKTRTRDSGRRAGKKVSLAALCPVGRVGVG